MTKEEDFKLLKIQVFLYLLLLLTILFSFPFFYFYFYFFIGALFKRQSFVVLLFFLR